MAERLNRKQLGERLVLNVMTLRGYLLRGGAPKPDEQGLFDMDQVKEWAIACAATAKAGNAAVRGSPIERARLEKLRMEIASQRREDKRLSGELVPKKQIEPAISSLLTGLVKDMRQKFEQELPHKYRGRGLVEWQQMNAAAVDWIISRVREGAFAITKGRK